MVNFEVGSKVRIRKDCGHYGSHPLYNPADTVGTILSISVVGGNPYPIYVQWADKPAYGNHYNESELELATEEATIKPVKPHPLKGWKLDVMRKYHAGLSYKDIAADLERPYDTVYGVVQRYKDTYVHEEPETTEQQPKRKPTIFVIPDTQCKQGIDLQYLHWVGAYIARKKPDIIVHLGDHYDMASLSSYDKGQLSAEGRRVTADIKAGDDGLFILESYIKSVPAYNPRKVVTLGNHEERIDRYVSNNPEFQGLIGTDKLAFSTYGWEVYPFLTPVDICGIKFVHYLQNTMTGKPLGGTALARLKNVGDSFVMGHVQTYDFCQRPLPLSGKMQIGLIAGACYEHDEGYKGVQGNHHFRGCIMLYECAEGYAMHKAVTLGHMKELFERGVK